MNKLRLFGILLLLFAIIAFTCCQNASSGSTKLYTVSFDTAGGSSIDSQTVEEGASIEKPSDPTREGYSFSGWYFGDTAYDFSSKVTAKLTLNAKWNLNSFTVTFDSNGGSTVAAETVSYGETISKPTDPTNSPHNFLGWYNGPSAFDFSTNVTSNITLTAKWTTTVMSSIRYDSSRPFGSTIMLSGYLILDCINNTFKSYKTTGTVYMSGSYSTTSASKTFNIDDCLITGNIGKTTTYNIGSDGSWTSVADPSLWGFGYSGYPTTTPSIPTGYPTMIEQ